MKTLAFLSIFALAVTAVPRTASACGGLFCDSGPSSSTVIDQSAERIVFVKGEDSVRAYIQVQYQGDPVDFAWVIPVVSRPQLDVADPSIFNALDQVTAPQYTFPSPDFPVNAGCGGGGALAGCSGSAAESGGAYGDDDDAWLDDGPTTSVWSNENVGPYATAVITADEPEDLTDWLEENGYTVPGEAYAIIAEYVNEGSFFVAVRLQAQVDVDLIQPLVIEYQGAEPCVPLRLTQVAAQPNMGVLVWIIAEEQAYPYNYARAIVDDSLVVQNQDGTMNYLDLVNQAVDVVGNGRAFVTEYAQPTSRIPDLSPLSFEAEEIVRQGSYITRLYTQISPQEMSIDPIFELDADLADVSNIHDLTQSAPSAGILPRRSRAHALALSGGLPLALAIGMLFRARRRTSR